MLAFTCPNLIVVDWQQHARSVLLDNRQSKRCRNGQNKLTARGFLVVAGSKLDRLGAGWLRVFSLGVYDLTRGAEDVRLLDREDRDRGVLRALCDVRKTLSWSDGDEIVIMCELTVAQGKLT